MLSHFSIKLGSIQILDESPLSNVHLSYIQILQQENSCALLRIHVYKDNLSALLIIKFSLLSRDWGRNNRNLCFVSISCNKRNSQLKSHSICTVENYARMNTLKFPLKYSVSWSKFIDTNFLKKFYLNEFGYANPITSRIVINLYKRYDTGFLVILIPLYRNFFLCKIPFKKFSSLKI